MRDYILLYINGKRHKISGEQAFMTLTDYLRYEQGLTGTKVVCAEGDCGACTILRGQVTSKTPEHLQYKGINSCITFVNLLDCTHIVTVEGLKDDEQLSPVQAAMVEHFGAQCGFCTPGFVCAMTDLFHQAAHEPEDNPLPMHLSEKQIRNGLTGNLCRCTGYAPIIEAAEHVNLREFPSLYNKFETPDMLKDLTEHAQQGVHLSHDNKVFFSPTTYAEMGQYLADNQDSRLFSSATDLGVLTNKNRFSPTLMSSLQRVKEAYEVTQTDTHLCVGARVTLSDLETATKQPFPEFSQLLHIFASPQIKNKGTLVGNIANGSPIGDTLPFLMVADAEVEMMSSQGVRRVNMNQFYKGYKQLDMREDEFISRVLIPFKEPGTVYKLYKVSNRKDLDISTFTAGFRLKLQGDSIEDIRIAYGGVGPVVLRLPQTEAFLKGKALTLAHCQEAGKLAQGEITPISDVRGSAEYRLMLAANILKKLYHELAETQLQPA